MKNWLSAKYMGFKRILLSWGMLGQCSEAGALRSDRPSSPSCVALGLSLNLSSLLYSLVKCKTQSSLLMPLPSLFLGFPILLNFIWGLSSLLWLSCLSFSSPNLFFPSFETLSWNPFKADSDLFGFFSLLLQALRCVCLISWTLSLQLKLETYRSITDARVSWSSRPEIAQVYLTIIPVTAHERAALAR